MAEKYSDVYPQAGALGRTFVDACYLHGRKRTVGATLIVNNQAAGDKGFVCKLPSACRITPDSWMYYEAITGSTNVTFGDANDPDGLVAAGSLAVAGGKSAIGAQPVASYGKRLWQMLGYAKDPRRELDLYVTLTDGTTNVTDKVIFFDLKYVVD